MPNKIDSSTTSIYLLCLVKLLAHSLSPEMKLLALQARSVSPRINSTGWLLVLLLYVLSNVGVISYTGEIAASFWETSYSTYMPLTKSLLNCQRDLLKSVFVMAGSTVDYVGETNSGIFMSRCQTC